MEKQQLIKIIEAALLAYGQPLTLEKIQGLFESKDGEENPDAPDKEALLEALEALGESCVDRGFELKKVSSGWRFQVREETASWVNRLWEEKPQKYSRALLETLAIIAYRQPLTRSDIEEIRGVAVSSNIIKTLTERDWIKVVGHRDVPGRPSLFATTRQFLDYFNLENLESLPTLSELADIESLAPELALEDTQENNTAADSSEPEDISGRENSPEPENSAELEDSPEPKDSLELANSSEESPAS